MEIHQSDLENSRIETIFYLTMLITVIQAGLIIWDTATMLPGGAAFFKLDGPNTIVASDFLSTLYLVFLGSYAGYKEFMRWVSPSQAYLKASSGHYEVPVVQALRIRRGDAIITFWSLLTILASTLLALNLIERLPHELFRTALQALGIWMGTGASKSLRNRQLKANHGAELQNRENEPDYTQEVIEYVKKNGYITNGTCQGKFCMTKDRAFRLLSGMEDDGKLKREGGGRSIRYVAVDNVSSNMSQQ